MKDKIINTIKNSEVKMRSRGYFIARAVLAIIVAIVVLFLLLFVITFILFTLRENGGFFAANFGPTGWGIFLESLPWSIFLLSIALLLVLWLLLRRYAIVYHQPFLYTLLILIVMVSIAALFLLPGSLQGGIFHYVSQNRIPMVTGVYEFETAPMNGVYRGQVAALATTSIILKSTSGQTSTVLMVPAVAAEIRAIVPGDYVIIFGRQVATATIEVSGVERMIEY